MNMWLLYSHWSRHSDRIKMCWKLHRNDFRDPQKTAGHIVGLYATCRTLIANNITSTAAVVLHFPVLHFNPPPANGEIWAEVAASRAGCCPSFRPETWSLSGSFQALSRDLRCPVSPALLSSRLPCRCWRQWLEENRHKESNKGERNDDSSWRDQC